MALSKMRITKALIRLRGCAGCSAPVLFANPRRQVFSRRGPYTKDMLDSESSRQQVYAIDTFQNLLKVSKGAKIRNRYN